MLTQNARTSFDAIAQEVNGETVILDLKSEQYFSLDTVGTRVWQLLQETTSLRQIFDQLVTEYEVEPEQLEEDLGALIDSLVQEGLIALEQ
ncbi:MAG: hypothetical protein ACI8Z1_003418 [Candidatus Azotimanducaceae bacterium]|jgi:hypothetical protein